MDFSILVEYIEERLNAHHKLYRSMCKSVYWEENFYWALKQVGLDSDWKPTFSHKVGEDQKIIISNISISNKSGSVNKNSISISGSRMTKHKTLEEKIQFLGEKTEDYIACLATNKDRWKAGDHKYYFAVVDANKLNYVDQVWTEKYGQKPDNKGEVVGWECYTEDYYAKIVRSNSDQLWTDIYLPTFDEIHEIVIK